MNAERLGEVDGFNLGHENFRENFDASELPELLKEWLLGGLRALGHLHDESLVHGDVSPKNLIVRKKQIQVLTLIDYDFICEANKPSACAGTVPYAPYEYSTASDRVADPSNDVYSLATSLFEAVIREPTDVLHVDGHARNGLKWSSKSSEHYGHLRGFFDKATHPERAMRFANANEALSSLTQVSEIPLEIQNMFRDGSAYVPLRKIDEKYPGLFQSLAWDSDNPSWLQGSFHLADIGNVKLAISSNQKSLYRIGVQSTCLLKPFALHSSDQYGTTYKDIDTLTLSLKHQFPFADFTTPLQLNVRYGDLRIESLANGIRVSRT